jgi:c-Rel proto-oncogene protein
VKAILDKTITSAPDGTLTCEFRGLAIECVKKSQIQQSLMERQANRVDPFKQGFKHATTQDLDLMSVRLCFQASCSQYLIFVKTRPKMAASSSQVFLKLSEGSLRPLPPVVSKVIRDRKKFCSLSITDVSTNVIPASGGVKVMLLCNRVFKEDLKVTYVECTFSTFRWLGFKFYLTQCD